MAHVVNHKSVLQEFLPDLVLGRTADPHMAMVALVASATPAVRGLVQAAQFWPLGNNSSIAQKRCRVRKTLSGKRNELAPLSLAPVRLASAPCRSFFRTGAQVRNRPF